MPANCLHQCLFVMPYFMIYLILQPSACWFRPARIKLSFQKDKDLSKLYVNLNAINLFKSFHCKCWKISKLVMHHINQSLDTVLYQFFLFCTTSIGRHKQVFQLPYRLAQMLIRENRSQFLHCLEIFWCHLISKVPKSSPLYYFYFWHMFCSI